MVNRALPDTPAPRRGKAKGVVVGPMVDWFASEHGEAGLDELWASLDPMWTSQLDRKRPTLGIVPRGWYDEELASDLASRIFAIASPRMTEADVLRAIGRTTVERSLGRISRAVVEWFASPQSAAVSAQLSWRLYHSTGWISASVEGKRLHAVGSWGLHGEKWCAVVGASAVHVLVLTGLGDAGLVRHLCSGGGGSTCEMTLGWS